MARYKDIENQMAVLDIEDEENAELTFEGDIEEEVNKYELCLIGRYLTEKNINNRAMQTKMADVWKPAMGVNIKEIESGIYLFQFYHREDLNWVLQGGSWSFDNAMLVINIIPPGEDPLKVPLWHLRIWVQIHELPAGFMSETVGKQLGNFFGEFLEYDAKNNSSIWREYMRVKIRLDVRKPLKRKKKITRKNGTEFIVHCKYERLGDFCFKCGSVSHTERFCRKFLDRKDEDGTKEWGSWLRAPPRRAAGQGRSKWLRDEGDIDWAAKVGKDNNYPVFSEEGGESSGVAVSKDRGFRDNVTELVVIPDKAVSNNHIPIDKTGGKISNFSNGLDQEELNGLHVEDRKRRRSGLDLSEKLVTDEFYAQEGAVLSIMDSTATNTTVSPKLAEQASRFQ